MSWKLRRAKTYLLTTRDKEWLRKCFLVGAIIFLTGYWICEIFPLFFTISVFNWGFLPLMILL